MSSDQIRLQSLNFEQEIGRLTGAYYQRHWLDHAINQWLHTEGTGFLLLVGEPGTGKSAMAAHTAVTRADVVARHFCIDGQRSTIVPGTALRSIASQLMVSVPGYSEALANTARPVHLSVTAEVHVGRHYGGMVAGVFIGALGSADPVEEFELLLRAPLSALPAPESARLIVIDGLDEAVTFSGDQNLATLFAHGGSLPAWIRILCTTRPERRVLRHFDRALIVELNGSSSAAEVDVAGYIGRRLKLYSSQDVEVQKGCHELGVRLPRVAGGNFLYAKLVLDEWEADPTAAPSLLSLPSGLNSIYARHLRRFSHADWEQRFSLVLGTLAVAQEPIDEVRLAQLSELTRGQIRDALSIMVQFTRIDSSAGEHERYTLFHRSLRDFLLDGECNRDYWCDPYEHHSRVVRALRRCSEPWLSDSYALRQLIFHLVASGGVDEAFEILRGFDYLEEKLVQRGTWALIDDVDLVMAHMPSKDVRSTDLGQLRSFLLAQSSFLQSHPRSLMQQALNQPATSCVLQWTSAGVNAERKYLKWLNRPAADPAISVLTGHEERLVSCSWSAKDGGVVSADSRGSIKWWDTRRGECVATEIRKGTDVLAWSADGQRYIADIGSDLVVVEARSAVVQHRLDLLARGESSDRRRWAGGSVEHCVWSADERYFVWGRSDRDLELWNICTGETRMLRRSGTYSVSACALSPDGTRLAIAGGKASATIIDTSNGQEVVRLGSADTVVKGNRHTWTVFSGHRHGVACCAWSPDGKRLATAGGHGFGLEEDDFSVRIWDAVTGQELACMLGHADRVVSCCWSHDGKRLATASGSVMTPGPDNSLRVWDAIQYRQIAIFNGHTNEVVGCTFSSDGKRLLSASKDRSLRIWDATLEIAHDLHANRMAVSPNGALVALALDDHTVELVDIRSMARVTLLKGHEDTVRCMRWSPSSKRIATGASDRTLRVWDPVTGQPLTCCEGHEGETSYTAGGHRIEWGSVDDCAWAPDESRVASASNDGLVIIWNALSGAALLRLQGHEAPVASCEWTMDGRYVVSTGGSFEHLFDPTIRLWDAVLGTELGVIDEGLALALCRGGAADQLRVLEEAMSLHAGPNQENGQSASPRAFARSSDCRAVAVWTSDRFAMEGPAPIYIVEEQARRVRCELQGHNSTVTTCAWSLDSMRLASASEDGTVRLWDAIGGEELAVFPTLSTVVEIAFCLNDTAILALDEGGQIYALELMGVQEGIPFVTALPRFRFAQGEFDATATGHCRSCGNEIALELQRSEPGRQPEIESTSVFCSAGGRCPSCGRECELVLPEHSPQKFAEAEPLNAGSGQAWIQFATGLILNKTGSSLAAKAIANALLLDSQEKLIWHWRDDSTWRWVANLLREHGEAGAAIEAERRAT